MLTREISFFTPKEFRCKHCGKGQPAAALVLALEVLRRAWGGPVIVNSGWRCKEHNKAVGGSESSRHLIGCAADIRPRDAEFFSPFKLLVAQMYGGLDGWEFKMYPSFVHLAVPRSEAQNLWSGDKITVTTK